MDRSKISITVMALAVLALLVVAPTVLFVLVAAVLLGLFLRGGGTFVSNHSPASKSAGVGLALAFAPAISGQIDDLSTQLPEAFDALRQRIASVGWLDRLLARLVPDEGAGAAAASTVSTTLSALGGFVVLGFIALYGALNPQLYRQGFLALFAPAIRPRAAEVLAEVADTLRGWIVARLFSMTVVGVLTTLGYGQRASRLRPPSALSRRCWASSPTSAPSLPPCLRC